MNNVNPAVLAVILFSGVMFSGAVQAACNARVTATAPDSRYTDHGDGTVTDKVTGLMWKQCSEGQSTTTTACGTIVAYTWQGALQQAEALNNNSGLAGYTDWRLPNRNELASLVERQCTSPAINRNLFTHTFPFSYWSSSPYANDSVRAWLIDFFSGAGGAHLKSRTNYVRLVRGGF